MLSELDPDLLAYASEAELDLIQQAAKMELALQSPLDFAAYTTEATTRHPHLELLNEIILALVEHRLYKSGPGLPAYQDEDNLWRHPVSDELAIVKLSISMPPQHGKSYLISHHLPAWFITKFPDKRVILASYEADFAASWGLKARRIIEDHPEFGNELDPSSRSGKEWRLHRRTGGMQTAGAGGSITGKGGHLLIADDLVKNDEEVRSKTERDFKESWWHSTFITRVPPSNEGGTVTINVHTRWHEDDITGRLLSTESDWYVLNLPALAFNETDEDGTSIDTEQGGRPDPIMRHPGEALCHAFKSAAELIIKRDGGAEGARWFNALYQGRPSIDDGGIFSKSDMRYHVRRGDVYELTTDTGTDYVPLKTCYRFITVDLAATTKTSADFTVFSLWDAAPGNRLILADVLRDRMESADHMAQLLAFVKKHSDLDRGLRVRFVGVEKATYGITLIQNLIRTGGVIVRPLTPDKDKVTRALPAGQVMKNHQVFFPKEAAWLPDWVDELSKFDNAAHDDQVDTFSYAVDVWLNLPVGLREAKTEAVTVEERVHEHVEKLIQKKKRTGRIRVGALGRW